MNVFFTLILWSATPATELLDEESAHENESRLAKDCSPSSEEEEHGLSSLSCGESDLRSFVSCSRDTAASLIVVLTIDA